MQESDDDRVSQDGSVVLTTDELRVEVDPFRGGDVLSVVDRGTGAELLFRTPWRARADAVSAGRHRPVSSDTWADWLEGYRGGWQILCPNAGPARVRNGVRLGFHGEASTVTWRVTSLSAVHVTMETELFTVPLVLERRIELAGAAVRIVDLIRNESPVTVEFDYVSHPAFAGALAEPGVSLSAPNCVLRSVTEAGDSSPPLVPEMANLASTGSFLGWLEGDGVGDVLLHHAGRGAGVRVQWDRRQLPFAWVWIEMGGTTGFPWFGRARVVAVEPASTPPADDRRQAPLELSRGESMRIAVAVTFVSGTKK